jgi:CheY-like chemotaxis protein
LLLTVADTGSGISLEHRQKIFDPFFTTKFTGRGLGLAAVQGIVRRHKGGIQLQSTLGRGTTFKVIFPFKDGAGRRGAPPPLQQASRPEPSSAQKTILLVDDEEIVRTVATRMLQRGGFAVLTAMDGESALEIIAEGLKKIDAILLDLNMPKMDGLEVYGLIRRQFPRGLPVILCSGYSEQDATRHFSGQGLADFLQKPYDYQSLIRKVAEVIAQGGG